MPLTDPLQRYRAWVHTNILLPVTCCFMAGIISGRWGPHTSIDMARLLLSGVAAIIVLSSLHNRRHGLWLMLPLFFLIGNLAVSSQQAMPSSRGHLSSFFIQQHRVTLIGTVETMIEHDGRRSRLILDVRQIQLLDRKSVRQPTRGKIRLTMRGPLDDIFPGDTLMIMATAGRITNFKTPGVFDYSGYMAAKNIFVSGWIQSRNAIIKIQDQTRTPLQRMRAFPEQTRQHIARYLTGHLNKDIAGLYQALLIGSRARVAPVIQEQFKISGTMHLLAISGLHMGLLGLMIRTILTWIFKRSQWLLLHTHVPCLAMLSTLPFLLGYAFIAGMNTPVLRALVMAMVLLTAVLARRRHSILHLVATAALVVLVINPLALFTASFQLSFSAATTLALFMPIYTKSIEYTGQERHNTLNLYVRTGLYVSVIASIGTLPFMLYHFHRFSAIGPIMNLLVEPVLCFWALPWGLLAIPFIFIAPSVASCLFNIGSYGILAAQHMTRYAAMFPFSSFWTITPTLSEMCVYGALIILWSILLNNGKKSGIILPAALLLVLHFTWGLWFKVSPANSTITYLDVGQGTSTLLQLPGGETILLDAGGRRGSKLNVGERIIAPFLWKQRLWRIDTAVITHPHSDHFNGMEFILQHFHPARLYINGDRNGEGNYEKILNYAQQEGIDIVVPTIHDQITKAGDYKLEVLGMNGLGVNTNAPVNERCLVLKYTHNRRSFLFPADIDKKSEAILNKSGQNLRADILLAAHHGSATSNSKSFLRAVAPSRIVVSAGRNRRHLFPSQENIAYWQSKHIQTIITKKQGTIICSTNGIKLGCTTFTDQQKHP